MTLSISPARSFDSRGKRLANSPGIDLVRRALQMALPHGAQTTIAAATDRSPRRIAHQIEGDNALTADVFIEALRALPEAERVRISRLALAPASLYPASLPASQKLLPSVVPAAAATFSTLGRLVEAAALAEADGKVTRDEAVVIEEEAQKANAALAAITVTVQIASGQKLVP